MVNHGKINYKKREKKQEWTGYGKEDAAGQSCCYTCTLMIADCFVTANACTRKMDSQYGAAQNGLMYSAAIWQGQGREVEEEEKNGAEEKGTNSVHTQCAHADGGQAYHF